VTPLYESKGLYLETQIPPDLPPVYCDRVRIRQVILNLLSNAGRFAERGGARLVVERKASELVVSVSDTGPGIAPGDQSRIFEPFAQADGSIRRRYGGSGLGLAISKRFVELHRGGMWFESAVGEGTTFHFSLPLDEPSAGGAAGITRWFSPYHEYQPRTRPSRVPRAHLAPRYVVMETGGTLRRLLSRYHEEAEVVSVHSLEEAVAEVSRVPAHALIVNDPACQGNAYPSARLTSLPYGTPVVMCWLPGRKEAADRLGLVEYLMKPVGREELMSALDALGRPLRSILVVDDEPEALQLYGRIVASAGRGYRVLRAPTGQRALNLLRERRPDVMLLDLVMPGLDGYAVLREKSQDPEIGRIPVIALSAQDPSRGPIASDLLTISRSGGLYLQDLLNSIDAISRILAPPDQSDDPTRAGNSRD
jgi:DNA-binding response OmpR family regulator